jgi:hypothetical protein
VSKSEVDYNSIRIISSATVAGWAAMTKDGISKGDAEMVVKMLDLIESYHGDGTFIDVKRWTSELELRVLEPRYQALGVVLVQLIAYELERHGVATMIPLPENTAGKILSAIRAGVMVALTPYLSAKV